VNPTKAGVCGRMLRFVFGGYVMIVALPVWFVAGWGYNLRSLGIMTALLVFYTLVHFVVSRYLAGLNRWIGAILAVTPVILVWFYGQGGGPLFGQGEGGTAAITYIGVSLLIDALRADSGCEVMALPGLIFGNRTHLACFVFSPVDALESRQRVR
jgi:hypothetical protein